MSSGKGKRPADNVETSDDKTNSKLKKPRLSGSTSQEAIPNTSTQSIPRQLPEPYIATLPFSSFSATHGLEIFPVPSPPPEPILDQPQDPGPSCSSSAGPTNPASSVYASRPQPSKSLNNGKTAAEGMELRIWNEWRQFIKGEPTVTNNLLASKDSRPVVEEQTLPVAHQPPNDTPMGIQKDLQNMEHTQGEVPAAIQHQSGETLPPIVNLLASKDSRPIIEEQTLQVTHRPQNDTPMGIQRDDLENMEHTQGEVPAAIQHPSGETLPPIVNLLASKDSRPVVVEEQTLQVIHQPPNDTPMGIQKDDLENMEHTQGEVPEATQHPSGETLPPIVNLLASKDSRPVIEEQTFQVAHIPQNDTPMGIQRDDLENMEHTQGEVPEATQHPSGETLPPIRNAPAAMESSVQGEISREQRPRRSPRRIQSQEKKP